jgi:RNA polymerase sigma factor (sigma-70 family)
MNRLMDHLRRAAQTGDESLGDGELLGCFLERREEGAFAALLRRHGPMVLGVCRRILGNVHDAEDAFQATFLILVRKAASVRPREAVGNWLYGVAYRTALEARTRIARRRGREKQMEDLPHPEVQPEEHWPELQPLLDRELHRLSDKYRLPVVLCDVEGRSRKEVARQLAIPEGTLSSRLATARKRLAERLTRHGFVFSGGSLAVLLADNAASAWVPASLSAATTKAAMLVAAGQTAAAAGVVSVTVATLTDGVLKAMLVAKLKTATVVLCGVAALGLGTGGAIYQTRAGAAGPRQQGAGPSRVVRSDDGTEQQKDKARRSEQEPRDWEQELQKQLDRAQKQLQSVLEEAKISKAEAEQIRKRVEEDLRRAREQIERSLQSSKLAREEALRKRLAKDNQPRRPESDDDEDDEKPAKKRGNNADQQIDKKSNRSSGRSRSDPKNAAEDLEKKKAQLIKQFEERRRSLMRQLERLEAEKNKALARMEKQQAEMKKSQITAQPKPPQPKQPQTSGDKLDQILERLERLEKRLDRVERQKE